MSCPCCRGYFPFLGTLLQGPRSESTARELLAVGASRIEKEFAGQPDMYDTMSEEKPMAHVSVRTTRKSRQTGLTGYHS